MLFRSYGEVLVVTDDFAERDTASAVGAMTSSCFGFIQTIHSALDDLQRHLKHHNQRERGKFRNQ